MCVFGGGGGGLLKTVSFLSPVGRPIVVTQNPLNKKFYFFYFFIFRGGGGRVPTGQVVTAHSLAQIHFHFPDKCHLFINY